MTVAHYEDESASESHPLDMLERCVEDNGWPFERSGRDELNLSVAGRWCDHHFCFTWRDDLQSLHLSSAFDMRVDDSRRTDIATTRACGRGRAGTRLQRFRLRWAIRSRRTCALG